METKTTDEIIHEHSISDNCNVKWVRVSEIKDKLNRVKSFNRVYFIQFVQDLDDELSQSSGDDRNE